MTRYIQQTHRESKKEKPERSLPQAGKYTVKNLQEKGVKSGVWEKKDA